MLSYQHGYHAGNAADVHKHSLLAWVLHYMTQKDKPLSYIETHAGRGLYDLTDAMATKTGEAEMGVARLLTRFASNHPFPRLMAELRAQDGAAAYPGSPVVAALSLREDDRMHLAELHPQEFKALEANMAQYGAQCLQQDGLTAAQALCPPTPRRGLMLIDPPYEVKTDYQKLPKSILQLHRKWNVGVIMLWYPILQDSPHKAMLKPLQAACPDALTHEVTFPPVRPGHRMIGSGLFVINPPFGLAEAAADITALFQDAYGRPM